MSCWQQVHFYILLFVLSLCKYACSQTQQPQYDPLADFCRRFAHQTTVIGGKLFIDGGLVDYGGGITSSTTNYTNTYLLYLDLQDLTNSWPTEYANLSKPSTVPSVQGGSLWGDTVNQKFYLYGGEYNSSIEPPSQYTLWAYDVMNDSWAATPNDPSATGINAVSFGASTVVDDRAWAFYYGGWQSNATTWGWTGAPVAQTGLLKYDMVQNQWTNATFIDTTPRAEGLMAYIPASDAGMLVYFGGIEQTNNNTYTGVSMNQIYLYDIAIGEWYIQSTSGPSPGMRRRFCGGASWADDFSSYNIYLYGGLQPPDQQGLGFGDVWILSMPSFTWTQWYNNSDDGSQHHSTTCNVIDLSQMLIMGGYFPNSSNIDCDAKSIWGQHNLNLGANDVENAEWYQFEPNVTSYQVPSTIYDAIGGGPTGGATLVTPAAGWGDPALAVYFTRHYSSTTRTPTNTAGASHTSSGSASVPGGHHTNIGAIAGGAVGGAAVLIGLVLLGCFCLRRHKRNKQSATAMPAPPGPNHHSSPHMSEMPSSPVNPASKPSEMPSSPVVPASKSYQQSNGQSPASYRGSPPPAFAESGWAQLLAAQTSHGQQEPPQHYYPPPSQAQPFYPPPPDPQSQSHDQGGYRGEYPLFPLSEMPNVRSPEQRQF